MKASGIFDVDTRGMHDRAKERGIEAILRELYSNTVDEPITATAISVISTDVRGQFEVTVEDDAPDGFQDLKEAYTLYAPSKKRGNAELRGRWNIGEKFAIAFMQHCEIISTTGGVRFDDTGRHMLRTKRDHGTVFRGVCRSNREEVDAALHGLMRMIVPPGITATVNNLPIPRREPVATVTVTLPTVLPNEDGILTRHTRRQTTVSLYEPLPDTRAMLYEMGVPVCETGDAFDVNVGQRVPLNQDRDGVTEGYLAAVRAVTLNAAVGANALEGEHVSETWVREGAGHKDATPESVRRVMDLRFGPRRVAYDPSDSEANKRAVENGYTLVYARNLSNDERANVKAAGALIPAGQKFPTHQWENSTSPDAEEDKVIPVEAWSPGMCRIVAHARFIAGELLGVDDMRVTLVNEPIHRAEAVAAYSPGSLIFNAGRLGFKWFDRSVADPKVNDILIHEYAHHYSSDHLSRQYHDALSDLGARMVALALQRPESFRD